MDIEAIRRVALNHYMHPGNTAESMRMVSPDVIYHSKPDDPTYAAWEQAHERLLETFRIDASDIVQSVVEGDLVMVYWTSRITQIAPFFGLPSEGKTVSIRGFGMDRVRDGKVVEHWGLQDMIGTLMQLGAKVVPAEGK